MAGLVIHSAHSAGTSPRQITGVLAASQTFDYCDPVGIVSDAIDEPPRDNTEILVADLFVGFAAQAARGVDSATRANLTYGGSSAIQGGAVAGSVRSYFPATEELTMRTNNWFTAAGAARAIPAGTDRGTFHQITFATLFNCWGLETTAGVIGTDVVAQVLDVLDANMVPIPTSDTTNGVWVIFRIVGRNQWQGDQGADPAVY